MHSRRRGQFAEDIESEMEVAPDEDGGHSNQAFITDENESEVQFSLESLFMAKIQPFFPKF